MAVSIALFALFWRLAYAPPHAFWAVLTTGSVALAGTLTCCCGLNRIICGPHRIKAAAITVIGTTPIFWLALFILSLFLQVRHRSPVYRGIPTYIAAHWVESIADVEARLRYPRWTMGRHVMLLDDGQTPQGTELVGQMDRHIEAMAARLHASVPSGQARWVRGALLWQHGNALISWAICDSELDSPSLTALDRHEMAHVAITLMGDVDQCPPMLLAEGWAESQSKDRNELIIDLADRHEHLDRYTLQELVGPEWYGRSFGPVYYYGGPLVIYLMEHYGPEKFLALYNNPRSSTFLAHCEQILGDSWSDVEEHFWQWLQTEQLASESRRKDLNPPSKRVEDVTLAESVSREDWQAIVKGYRATYTKRPPWPKSGAIEIDSETERSSKDADKQIDRDRRIEQYVIEDGHFWLLRSFSPSGRVGSVLGTRTSATTVYATADGEVEKLEARQEAAMLLEEWHSFARGSDLGCHLPLDPNRHYTPAVRIERIQRPSTPAESIWEIDVRENWPDDFGEVTHYLKLDSAAGWSVISSRGVSPRDRSDSRYELRSLFNRPAATESVTHWSDNAGNTVSSQNHIRELTSEEAKNVRQKVEAMTLLSPTRRWYVALVQPHTLACIWPIAGVILLGVDWLWHRRTATGRFAQ